MMRPSRCNIQGAEVMSHDRKFEIPDPQQLASEPRPHPGVWTEIGEAQVTQTIFGRAKVRIIRESDKVRQAWMMTGVVVVVLVALSALLWQLRSDPANEVAQVPEPVMRVTTSPEPDMVAPPALPHPASAAVVVANTQHRVIPRPASGVPAYGVRSALPASGVKHVEVMARRPVPPQAATAGNPHPATTNAVPTKNVQAPPNKPATATPNAIPAVDPQLSDPINVQVK